MKTKILILAMLSFGLMNAAFAESEGSVGNGGADILYKGKHYLLDLYEAGAFGSSVYTSSDVAPRIDILARVNEKIGRLVNQEVVRIIASKITEISKSYPLLGKVYTFQMESVTILTPPDELKDPYQETSAINYEKQSIARVAYRKGNRIYLNSTLLKNFDSVNQSALFLHEWTSSILNEVNDSVDTRAIIGAIYTSRGFNSSTVIFNRYGLGHLLDSNLRLATRRVPGKLVLEDDARVSLTYGDRYGQLQTLKYLQLNSGHLESDIREACESISDCTGEDVHPWCDKRITFSYQAKVFTPGDTGLSSSTHKLGYYLYKGGAFAGGQAEMNHCSAAIHRFVGLYNSGFKY